MIQTLTLLLLVTGALASGLFALTYLFVANLKLKTSRQIIILNSSISGVLILALVRRFDLLPSDIILYSQMFLFVFINAALIYQFKMLKVARELFRDSPKEQTK